MLKLISPTKQDGEIVFLTLLLGVLTLLERDRGMLDYIDDRLFNPYSLDVLRESGISQETIDLLNRCLFLGDYESLGFSNAKFNNSLNQIKSAILTRLEIIEKMPPTSQKWLQANYLSE